MYTVKCQRCNVHLSREIRNGVCPNCNKLSNFEYDLVWQPFEQERSMWRFRNLLPIENEKNIVTLGEGITPLLKSDLHFHPHVYLKDETRNPTGSMKDRAMSVAYSKAKELKIKRAILMSAGGAGIAASAYASRAGIKNTIFIPIGVNEERKMMMQIYGSELIEIDGNIEDCLRLVEHLADKEGIYQTSTYKKGNPYTSEGPKTIAYELFEQMNELPDVIFIPVGGAGTLGGIWRGFSELKQMGLIDKIPKLVGVQNEKFNGLELGLQRGYTTDEQLHELDHEIDSTLPTVTASIKHSYVPDGVEGLEAIRDTDGYVITVSDDEAMEGQKMISTSCGLFVEPGSATTVIALKKAVEKGMVKQHETVVLLLTGSGYREMTATTKFHGQPPKRLNPEEAYKYMLECD
jgi:threonine synthase